MHTVIQNLKYKFWISYFQTIEDKTSKAWYAVLRNYTYKVLFRTLKNTFQDKENANKINKLLQSKCGNSALSHEIKKKNTEVFVL